MSYKKISGTRGTGFRKILIAGLAGYLFLMLLIAVLTSMDQDKYFSSRNLHSWSTQVPKELLFSLYAFENRLFSSEGSPTLSRKAAANMVFEFATRIDIHDPRTLLGKELPGLASFDGKIVVAGDGTDFTNMPVESAPPMEVLMQERAAASKRLSIADEEGEELQSVTDQTIAHIIHSHSRESYLPELEEGAGVAFHPEVNITLVGERLGRELEERGIGTTVDKTDIEKKLQENGWEFPKSYDVSRNVLQEAIEQNNQLELFFDIHRDSRPREDTTVTINGETIARTMFVIGENNPHYEKNLQMAKDLHYKLDEKYPGLSRGVITKGGAGSNGRYNQDLSEKSVLIEVGGIDNTLEESYRAVEILAEVISEQYKEAESVKGGDET